MESERELSLAVGNTDNVYKPRAKIFLCQLFSVGPIDNPTNRCQNSQVLPGATILLSDKTFYVNISTSQ